MSSRTRRATPSNLHTHVQMAGLATVLPEIILGVMAGAARIRAGPGSRDMPRGRQRTNSFDGHNATFFRSSIKLAASSKIVPSAVITASQSRLVSRALSAAAFSSWAAK